MKNIFVLFMCFFFLSPDGFAQPGKLPEPHFSFAAIVVSNIDSSINWYRTNLGMQLKNKVVSKERGFKQANLLRGHIHIELIELRSGLPREEVIKNKPGKEIEGFAKLGFSVKGFDNWHLHLVKQKVKLFGGIVNDPQTGKRMFLVTDPDGNKIQIFEE